MAVAPGFFRGRVGRMSEEQLDEIAEELWAVYWACATDVDAEPIGRLRDQPPAERQCWRSIALRAAHLVARVPRIN